ncbi:hypothetical protein [Paucisalibacillus globulus]|uniref:hypothetical protein n=1 Tax=Paucisalibacillus globulus TaxID=351095 RepID=UPI00042A3F0B|nr:hypothetical protein [Paucisalibacillus globulus]
MKLRKLFLTMLIMILSTGVLFACSSDDKEDPDTNDDTTEQQDSGDAETDSDTEEDQE